MQTCKGLNDLLNNSDVFWFQRTVRPATADTDTWEELGRVYDTATGAVVPTINVPHIGLDTSIHKNLAKQSMPHQTNNRFIQGMLFRLRLPMRAQPLPRVPCVQ